MTGPQRRNRKTKTTPNQKTTGRRAAAAKPVAKRKKTVSKASSSASPVARRKGSRRPAISEDQRRRWIQEAAYFRAERRGFQGGDPSEDWLAAEAEIEAVLQIDRAAARRRR